jgi:basic membrane protein A
MALMLALILVFQMTGCNTGSGLFHQDKKPEASSENQIIEDEDIKIGFLFSLGTDAPDTISHMECIRKMQHNTGLKDSQILVVTNVGADDYGDQIEKLIGKGCDMIFAKASAAETAMIEAAKNHPEVEFCQEDGREVSESGLSNIHSFYVRLYEGYYAAGVAAGCKLNDLLNKGRISPYNCVIGFAATRKNPENISCINAFYLGIKQVCTQGSVIVRYVDSTGKYDKDDECARQLIAAGVRMMGQRVFTTAVAAACAENDIPIVGNEINLIDVAPNEAITSVVADWSIYYEYAVRSLVEGKDIDADWVAGYEENAVCLSQFNDAHLPEDTYEKVAETEKDLRKGKAKVFDTTQFTVDGSPLEELIKSDKSYSKYRTYVSKGEFKESRKQSVPVMEFLIDGITVSTENYLPEEETTESEDEN